MIRNNAFTGQKDTFDAEVQSFKDLGFLFRVEEAQLNGFFMPTFTMSQPEKLTTPNCLVHDAAAKFLHKGKMKSLTDSICSSPNVLDVILGMRRRDVVISGDVIKMFLNIKVVPGEGKYLRFFFRPCCEAQGEIEVLQFTSHVFGKKNSPFLSMKTVNTQAKLQEARYPVASKVIQYSTLIDDMLHSCWTPEEAFHVMHETKEFLSNELSMEMRKWVPNSPEVLSSIPERDRAPSILVEGLDPNSKSNSSYVTKTLGMYHLAERDL